MGLLGRFKKPKGKIELQLDEVAYDWKDKMTGRIVVDPEEEIAVDEFRIEFNADRKINVKFGRFSSYKASTSSSEDTHKIPLSGPVKLDAGRHHEQAFQVDIPLYRRDYFTEMPIKVKGVAAIKGRPDLKHELKPAVNLPYVIECLRSYTHTHKELGIKEVKSSHTHTYGGCGFVTEPSMEPPKICPQCGRNLEETIKRKYRDVREE